MIFSVHETHLNMKLRRCVAVMLCRLYIRACGQVEPEVNKPAGGSQLAGRGGVRGAEVNNAAGEVNIIIIIKAGRSGS